MTVYKEASTWHTVWIASLLRYAVDHLPIVGEVFLPMVLK